MKAKRSFQQLWEATAALGEIVRRPELNDRFNYPGWTMVTSTRLENTGKAIPHFIFTIPIHSNRSVQRLRECSREKIRLQI